MSIKLIGKYESITALLKPPVAILYAKKNSACIMQMHSS